MTFYSESIEAYNSFARTIVARTKLAKLDNKDSVPLKELEGDTKILLAQLDKILLKYAELGNNEPSEQEKNGHNPNT